MDDLTPGYDFGQDRFDLENAEDREIVRFVLSQALYGEATGVFCGKSLYAAGTLEAAKFYVRQAKQELAHLQLFAEIFRLLGLTPSPAHWVIRLLAAHNNYYPLKVFMEHAIGEGMVLDIFKDLLLQTLPDEYAHIPLIKKKLRVVCKEEIEHVSWGEKETRRLLTERPWLKTPYYGLFELQMGVLPFMVRAFEKRASNHRVLRHLGPFLEYVRERVRKQGQELGFVPAERPGFLFRMWAMLFGIALFLRSQFARSTSKLDKNYLTELGFDGSHAVTATTTDS
ncbi:ferritin-like domain-containing protein [Pendulispora brunnea]|uniref:Ferritin-like domain-containing protein n=1 Tax=Pendulispora brunnea TaxID=2905690 RepID=A0ABZ2KFT4_9BACT